MIDFDETGAPMPAFSEAEHIGKNKRAVISIDLYHLDHADLVDKKKFLAVKIAREVKVADRLVPAPVLPVAMFFPDFRNLQIAALIV